MASTSATKATATCASLSSFPDDVDGGDNRNDEDVLIGADTDSKDDVAALEWPVAMQRSTDDDGFADVIPTLNIKLFVQYVMDGVFSHTEHVLSEITKMFSRVFFPRRKTLSVGLHKHTTRLDLRHIMITTCEWLQRMAHV